VKIADFGIARTAETTRLTQMGSVMGTAAYLSPEQALGEEVTAAADLYSLGCVLYELLTGRTPYVFETLPELVMKHRNEVIPPVRELRPDVPERLETAVMHALARNPDYRPGSAAALAEELAVASPDPPTRPLSEAVGTQATEVLARSAPTQVLGATRAHSRRRKVPGSRRLWLALAAIAAAVALVIALAVAASDNGGTEQPAQAPAVQPVPPASDAAGRARNLANWLRENSR
jgi:serine/threonine-protein kinase